MNLSQQLGLGQAKATSLEASPGLISRWLGCKHLSHCLLPPRVCISQEVESEAELGPRYSDMVSEHLTQLLHHAPDNCPLVLHCAEAL